MMKKKYRARIGILILLMAVLFGCAREQNRVIYLSPATEPYLDAFRTLLPDRDIFCYDNVEFGSVVQNGTLEAFDVQALPLIEQNAGAHWLPLYLATPVIAIDRDLSQTRIRRWSDLTAIPDEIGYHAKITDEGRMIMAAISYGLSGSPNSIQPAMNLATRLQRQGRFRVGSTATPVNICFDYEAAAWIQSGRNLEIIVPEDGTITYERGLLGNEALSPVAGGNTLLYASGLRLLDGSVREELYPSVTQYEPAVLSKHLEPFHHIEERYNRDFRRQVLQTRLYSSSDGIEHIMVPALFIVFVLLWMEQTHYRVMQTEVRTLIRQVAILICGWIALRYLKYQTNALHVINRYCWYGFYIFQLMLPLTFAKLAEVVDDTGKSVRSRTHWNVADAFVFLLIAAVLTNDYHGQVLQLELGSLHWDREYSHGLLFYIIYGVTFLLSVYALGLLSYKAIRKKRKKGFLLVGALFLVMALYSTGYILNVPIAQDSDITMTICLFVMLLVEFALQTDLIPMNAKYKEMFEHSALRIQILDRSGNSIITSGGAVQLSEETVQTLLQKSERAAPVKMIVGQDAIFAGKIPGGIVVWEEDIGALQQLQESIRTASQRLETSTQLLQAERVVREEHGLLDAEWKLLDELEAEIRDKAALLSQKIHELPGRTDHWNAVSDITLLLCHIKRRSSLFFKAKESDMLHSDEFAMYLDELSELAALAEVKVLTACGRSVEIPMRQAVLLYDFFYAVLSEAQRHEDPVVIERLLWDNRRMTLQAMVSYPIDDVSFLEPGLLAAIDKENGTLHRKDIDDAVDLSLSFEWNGGEA